MDEDAFATGMYYVNTLIPAMQALRKVADTLETKVSREYWPMPTYTDLLYHV